MKCLNWEESRGIRKGAPFSLAVADSEPRLIFGHCDRLPAMFFGGSESAAPNLSADFLLIYPA